MASPAAPTIGQRGGEPPAPVFSPVRRDSFPNEALGITPPVEDANANAGTDQATGDNDGEGTSVSKVATAAEGASTAEPTRIDPGAVAPGTATTPKAGNAKAKPQPGESANGEIHATTWDEIKQRPEYQRDLTTALNKQHDRLKAELVEAEATKGRLKELEDAQREYDELLERANNDSDPIEQARAQQQLTEHVRVQHLNAKIEAQLRPAIEANARATIAALVGAQYEEGYKNLEEGGIVGKDLLAEIRHTNFEHGGAWLETLVKRVFDEGAAKGVADFRKKDMEAELKARVAEAMGGYRANLGNVADLSEGVAGGTPPGGEYRSVQDVYDAIARGPQNGGITAGRGRAILQRQFGRRF